MFCIVYMAQIGARVADEIAPIPHGFRVKSARARG